MRFSAPSVASMRVPWGIHRSMTNWFRSALGKKRRGTSWKSSRPASTAPTPRPTAREGCAMMRVIALL